MKRSASQTTSQKKTVKTTQPPMKRSNVGNKSKLGMYLEDGAFKDLVLLLEEEQNKQYSITGRLSFVSSRYNYIMVQTSMEEIEKVFFNSSKLEDFDLNGVKLPWKQPQQDSGEFENCVEVTIKTPYSNMLSDVVDSDTSSGYKTEEMVCCRVVVNTYANFKPKPEDPDLVYNGISIKLAGKVKVVNDNTK